MCRVERWGAGGVYAGGMSKTRWLSADEQEMWRAFLWSSRLLFEALDRQLQRDAGLPHTYYIVLAALSEAPGRELTMSELALTVRGSASRLSHAVTRLEEYGWVVRARHVSDRRTTMARLTDAGSAVLEAAAPGHVETVRRLLFDPLAEGQVEQLRSAFRAVLRGLDPGDGPAARWSGRGVASVGEGDFEGGDGGEDESDGDGGPGESDGGGGGYDGEDEGGGRQ